MPFYSKYKSHKTHRIPVFGPISCQQNTKLGVLLRLRGNVFGKVGQQFSGHI